MNGLETFCEPSRAAEDLIIITDERDRSPFVPDGFPPVNWEQYPPAKGLEDRLSVQVCGQTHPLKDTLKLCGYVWRAKERTWEKAFQKGTMTPKMLKEEAWVPDAKNLNIQILDHSNQKLRHWKIETDGSWHEEAQSG